MVSEKALTYLAHKLKALKNSPEGSMHPLGLFPNMMYRFYFYIWLNDLAIGVGTWFNLKIRQALKIN